MRTGERAGVLSVDAVDHRAFDGDDGADTGDFRPAGDAPTTRRLVRGGLTWRDASAARGGDGDVLLRAVPAAQQRPGGEGQPATPTSPYNPQVVLASATTSPAASSRARTVSCWPSRSPSRGARTSTGASTRWGRCSDRSRGTCRSPTAPPAWRRPTASYLAQHNRPVKTLGDLLTTPAETDTVTLTLSTKLQQTAQQALGGRDGAIVVLDPNTGAVLRHVLQPDLSTPTRWRLNNPTTEAQRVRGGQHRRTRRGFAPAASLAYQDIFPPGSTFKVVTTTAAYEHAPTLVRRLDALLQPASRPIRSGARPRTCATTAAGDVAARSPRCSHLRATPGSPSWARRIGAASMTGRGELLRLQPAATHRPAPQPVRSLTVPPVVVLRGRRGLPGLLVDRPELHGRRRRCRWPWWRPGIADGGVVMTPHVMYQIRDSQNNLVQTLPTQAVAPGRLAGDGQRRERPHAQVVTHGTAAGGGVPAPGRRRGQDRDRPGRVRATRHHRLDDRLRPGHQPDGGRGRGHAASSTVGPPAPRWPDPS